MKFLMLVIVLLLGVAATINAQPSFSVRTPFSSIGANRRFPKMTTAPDGRIIMTYVQENGRRGLIHVALSSDAGTTWTEPSLVTDVLLGAISLQRQPYAVMDDVGIMHMVFEDQRLKSQVDVFYSRSTDNGITWTPGVSVSDDPDGLSLQDFSSIAVVPGGAVLISFVDRRSELDPNRHIFIVRSTDRGITWSSPSQVDQFDKAAQAGVCECCIQNIAATSDGRVAVAFRSNVSNQRDVYIAPSIDGGVTFTSPVRIASDTWTIDACPASGPTIIFDSSGTVHLSWMDERDIIGVSTIWYGRWPWMSRMLPMNSRIMSSKSVMPNWPDVAVTPDGKHVGVVWQTTSGVYFARSTNAGRAFDTAQIDQHHTEQVFPHIVCSRGKQFIVSWQANRDALRDVYVAKEVLTSVDDTALQDDSTARNDTGFVLYPNPSSTRINVVCTNGYAIFSAEGQFVMGDSHPTTCIDVTDLPPGIYILQSGQKRGRFVVSE